MNGRIVLAFPFVVFTVFAVLFYLGLRDEEAGGLTSALLGRKAPTLITTQLGDNSPPSDNDVVADGVKLLNFWASWCAPCRAEHPNLQELNEQGFTILGVNYKDQTEHALGFLAELGNPYEKTGADSEGRTAINWGVYGIPETFVIDSEGTVLLRWAGPVTSRALDEHIMPVLQSASAEQR